MDPNTNNPAENPTGMPPAEDQPPAPTPEPTPSALPPAEEMPSITPEPPVPTVVEPNVPSTPAVAETPATAPEPAPAPMPAPVVQALGTLTVPDMPANNQPTPPYTADTPVVSGTMPGAPVGMKRRLPKFLLPIVAAVVLLGGSAAAYFGYYVPNKPENIWRSALINSGKGYDQLTQYATTNKNAKGWDETGSFKFTGPLVFDGTLDGKSDGQTGDFSGSLSATGLKLGLDVRSFKSTGDTPDIYFRASGIEGLGTLVGGGDPALTSALNGLNNQWYVVDHTFFQQYAHTSGSPSITSQDVSSVLNAVGKASKKYIFTGDTQKMAIVVKQQVGREKLDGRSVYHYKVGVNKANLKAYVQELCNDLQASRLSKLLPSGNVQDTLHCADMKTAVDNIKDGDTADAWVDTRTKLIHDVRFYDKTDKNNYLDIGQDYQGGTTFPFLVASHTKSGSDTTDFGLKLTLDTKANSIKLQGELKGSGKDAENGTLSLTVTPNNTPVKVDRPTNAKTIIQLLDDFGVGNLLSGATSDAGNTSSSAGLFSGTQAEARDAKRQTDMNSLQTQLEAYFQESGHYPSLTDMNNPAWLSANMPSLDRTALQDPQGTVQKLASQPAAHVYAYHVTNSSGGSCEADDTSCAQYTLTATLEAGGTYVKANLD